MVFEESLVKKIMIKNVKNIMLKKKELNLFLKNKEKYLKNKEENI